jgi:hypothetical protein
MDGRAPRAGSDGYGAPAGRAGQDESAKRFGSAVAADHFEAGIDAYEKLARERSLERSLDRSRQKTADTAITAVNNTPANVAAEGENRPVLPDILGDEFDLRRAVIEAEILTPKYL